MSGVVTITASAYLLVNRYELQKIIVVAMVCLKDSIENDYNMAKVKIHFSALWYIDKRVGKAL